MSCDVLTFGETMISLHTEGGLSVGAAARTSVAGAESNVAVGLARLGHRVSWAGRLGADEPARLILRALRGEGVDVRHATTDPRAPTGAMLRERLPGDITRVHYWRTGSAASRQRPEHLAPALADGARLLHVTGITCAIGASDAVLAAVEHARAYGWTVVLDVNHRTRLWSRDEAAACLRRLRGLVDVLVASDDELPLVADEIGELLAGGVREVVVKRGGAGADLYSPGAGPLHQPALAVPVLDTVGAGDAFCAGYLSGLLDGLAPGERLHRAVAVGAFAVASRGDWEGLPHRDELALLDAESGSALR
ncbi:sugar kinase [Streptomyces roseirectus]|uniref:Sugar kinase n=1 Tax=Streptomyces roseirectus TaxID=2768066 RepID=A0A7H0I5I0_9ACTN|nr:sugar kinase [Streptomyces roseirectus]QNP68046.1 sugar kinase [Streptomyces roseirectus]